MLFCWRSRPFSGWKRAFSGYVQQYGWKTAILWLPAILMVLEYIYNDLGRTKSIYLEVKVGDDNEHAIRSLFTRHTAVWLKYFLLPWFFLPLLRQFTDEEVCFGIPLRCAGNGPRQGPRAAG